MAYGFILYVFFLYFTSHLPVYNIYLSHSCASICLLFRVFNTFKLNVITEMTEINLYFTVNFHGELIHKRQEGNIVQYNSVALVVSNFESLIPGSLFQAYLITI